MSVHACHYCGGRGDTKDHIVARHWYNNRVLPQFVAEANKVPACADCNNRKDCLRSDCTCSICTLAWELLAPYIRPKHKRDIPVYPIKALLREESA